LTQPTITVSLGRLTGWTLGTVGKSELGTTTTLATYTYTPITSRVIDFSIRRGRQHELDRIETGTATVTAINQDGALTPTNTSGAYYPDIRPMAPIKIQATWYPPAGVAGLVAAYDFSDATSMFTDTARTTPVAADGDIIKGVTDLSGTGKHLSEATNGPTYKVAIQNGQSVARFDGTNDILTYTGAVVSQPNTIVAFGKRIAGGASHFIDGTTARQIAGMPGGAFYGIFAGTTLSTATAVDTNPRLIVGHYNGASSKVWLDGGASVNGNAGTNALTDIVQTNAAFTNADLYELLIYNTALSLADINSLGSYLASKWGTTWTTAT